MDPLRILIVDDDPSLAQMLRLMLKKEAPAFSVAAVEGGKDCLDYLAGQHVDCVLCDYQMPGMSGMELLQELRSRGDDIPFIFITGQGNEGVARDAFTNGASDYFTKDWGFASFTKIVNSIEKAVRHRQIERSHLACETALQRSEARYRSFVENSSEAIWCVELDEGIPTSLAAEEQVDLIYRHAYLAECNEAGARLLEADRVEDVIGMRLGDIEPQGDPFNVEHIGRFVRSGYRLVKDPAHIRDVKGKTLSVKGSATGVVEDGFLVRAWGVTILDG